MIKIGLTDHTPVNKLIDIRNKNQVIKAKYAIGADDVLKYTLMTEYYIEISFSLNKYVAFKRSDYIEWEGDKYILREDYQPEQISKREYQYTLKFEAIEMFFQDIQFYYLNQGLKESEWSLTGNPEYFLKIAVDNINRYFKTTEYKLGTVEPSEIKFITFELNTNVFDALTQIADEYGAEWYMEGKTIHFLNKVYFGDEVDFETDVSVLSMQRQEGESGTRYTRIVPLGSTRNIPKDYRETTPGEGVDAIYPKRLRIPTSKGDVIDAYPNMSPDEVVEGTVIFDEVYPKRIGAIQAVGTKEYTQTDEDTGTQTKWNAYKIKDSGINFKEEYLLPGEELRLQFVSGDLNGMDFALIFHKEGFSNADNSQYFEIVRNDDYGKPLPNDVMKPKAGDQYVLYGFNIALVSDQYVPAGELELFDTATEWMQKQLKDTSVYECPTVIKHFMDHQMNLEIGQRVKLIFDDENISTRSSRIMGFEKKLNNKYDAIYTVGDNPTYSRLANIEQEIKELQVAGVVYEATGKNGVYVIKQFDTTRPTDSNVYSAKASDAKYFNKQTGGTVQGDALFLKNVQVQGTTISDVFQNSTFTAGQLGSGFQIKRDANGQSYIEVDNILVRREAVFNRLTIAEIKSVGGTILLSLASMVLSKVEVKASTWKSFFDTADGTIPNDFAVGDQAICRKFTGKNIKYYWALVTAVGTDYIELSRTDKDGSGVPAIGDEVVQLGNRTDVNRQYAIMLSAYGSAAPSINQYAGINSYDLTGKEVTTISPKGNKFTGSFIISTNGTTAPIYKERAAFVNGTVYYLNDRVSYLGSYWVCIVNTTITTPSEGSSTWRKDTAGQTDINNAINNISVGGRNLYIKSRLQNGWIDHNNGIDINSAIADKHDPTYYAIQQNEKYIIATVYSPINEYTGGAGRIYFYDKDKIYLGIQSAWCTGGPSGSTKLGSTLYNIPSNAAYYRYSVIHKDLVCKIEYGNKATDYSVAPEDIQLQIDNAQRDAINAQSAANNAQTDANTANNLLKDIASDNKLTSNEKQETKKEWDSIVSEYSKNVAQANKFGVSTTSYTSAYNVLNNYITPLLTNLGTTSDINGITFRDTFKAYYDARIDLLNAISSKAKELADTAQTAANNAQKEAEKVRSEYKADFVILDDKIASKVSQTDFNTLGQRVSTSESNIVQLSDSITSTVEKVDNIRIGGRNLFIKSRLQNGWIDTSNGIDINSAIADKHDPTYYAIQQNEKYIIATVYSPINEYTGGAGRIYFYDKDKIYLGIQSAWCTGGPSGSTKLGSTLYNIPSNAAYYRYSVIHKDLVCKIEYGNKATDYSVAPEDTQAGIDAAQSSANNAQNTADSKNKTYYQDAVPTIPSGGHKVGDLWHMESLVDIDGNINSDSTKNIYQLQRRWDGSEWVRINWSSSKAYTKNTGDRIEQVVTKTGIDSLGEGETLKSLIDQTPDQIKLEVSKVKVGGRNHVLNSTFKSSFTHWRNVSSICNILPAEVDKPNSKIVRLYQSGITKPNFAGLFSNYIPCKKGDAITVSFDVKVTDYSVINYTLCAVLTFYNADSDSRIEFYDISFPTEKINNRWVRVSLTAIAQDSNIARCCIRPILVLNGEVFYREFKIEFGNKATDWSEAEEDTQAQIDSKTTLDEVSSSLTLVDNKITLASKTIELKGTTIAKAIEAEDLKVGSRSGLSTLEVLKDGTFYAKGSSSSNSSLTIDSGTQSIEIVSPYSASWDDDGGSTTSGRSTIRISSQSGGVEVRDSANKASIMSTNGIFANKAGQGMYPSSTAINSKAAIVGLGNGSVYEDYGGLNFVAGIYGRASNTGSAPAYGGYFDMLRANGLVMSMIAISESTDQRKTLTKDVSFVVGNSTVMQTIYLPSDAYKGTVIWLKQWWTGYMRVRPSAGQRLFDDSSQNDYVDVGEGWTAMCVFIGNWGTGGTTSGTWLISKFKF